jgi:spermidine synthase
MIISVALLGFGVSGVVYSLNKKLKLIVTDKLLTVLSMCYGISIVVSFLIMNLVPFDPFSLFTDSMQFIYLPLYYLLITTPFFFAGLVISILLTKFKTNVSKLYFFDLIGAGLSCFAFIILMPQFGGNGTILFVAAFGFVSSMIFGYEKYKKYAVISFILMCLGFSFLIDKDKRFPIHTTENKIYANYIASRPDLNVFSGWNTFSKIDVMKEEEESPDGYNVNLAIIDEGNATTNIPNVRSLPPLTKPADASNLAFACKKDSAEKVFILGSGGGGEVLVSLYHNANDITGVEINGLLNNLIENKLAYWTGPLIRNNKKVHIITDDARSIIKNDKTLYDVIISAHTISSSAVSSGAMSMVENFIMTKEAIREYLEHLKSDGIIYISRPETQVPKLISTFRIVNRELPDTANDKKNFIVFKRPVNSFESNKSFMAGIVYKKNGFKNIDVINVRDEAYSLGLDIEYDPLGNQEGIYKNLIETDDVYGVKNDAPNLIPATDDKPFFDDNYGFGNYNWSNIKETFSQNDKAILALKDKPVAEVTLVSMLIQIFIISLLFLLFPFLFFRKRFEVKFEKKYLVYFAMLGLGYIMIQISLIQKFTLLLGQPVWTMITVISTLLIASGLGSRFTSNMTSNQHVKEEKIKELKKKIYIIFFIIVLYSIFIGLFISLIFDSFSAFPLFLRILFSVIIIFPLGFFMGMPFPIGISFIRDDENSYLPVAWAINAFFSVIGTVITIIFAMTIGFKIVFIISGMLYFIALIFISLRFKRIFVY